MKKDILIVGTGLALQAAIRALKDIKDANVIIVSHEMKEEELNSHLNKFEEPIKILKRTPIIENMRPYYVDDKIHEPIGAIANKGRKGKRRW